MEQRSGTLPTSGPPRTLRVALDPVLGDEQLRKTFGQYRRRPVLRRPGLTIVFRRMDPHQAVRAFRRGELDEAPVPQGEIRALEADPVLAPALRVRTLNGVDGIQFGDLPPELLRAYDKTAPRADYQALVSERVAPAAYGLTRDAKPTTPAEFREARASIRRLPRIPVAINVENVPELVEAAEIAWGDWRQLGLPVILTTNLYGRDANFVRWIPPPRQAGHFVALGWVAEARLVSPRIRGWAMDELGIVDYSKVSLEPGP